MMLLSYRPVFWMSGAIVVVGSVVRGRLASARAVSDKTKPVVTTVYKHVHKCLNDANTNSNVVVVVVVVIGVGTA